MVEVVKRIANEAVRGVPRFSYENADLPLVLIDRGGASVYTFTTTETRTIVFPLSFLTLMPPGIPQ